jgi:hypothetical protein
MHDDRSDRGTWADVEDRGREHVLAAGLTGRTVGPQQCGAHHRIRPVPQSRRGERLEDRYAGAPARSPVERLQRPDAVMVVKRALDKSRPRGGDVFSTVRRPLRAGLWFGSSEEGTPVT